MKCNGFAYWFWEPVERFDSDIFHHTKIKKIKRYKQMTKEFKIAKIDNRIALLKSRGETMNARIIGKLERQKRALLAQSN